MSRAYWLLALGALLLLPFGYALNLQDLRENTSGFLLAYGVAFILYALATIIALRVENLPQPILVGVFILAAALCAVLVFTPPTLSDDMYRYIWDGRVQAQGISPYRFPPEAAGLEHLRDPEIWPRINRKMAVTIYPPLAEMLFSLLWRIQPDSVRWFQAVMAGGALAAGALLVGLLRDLGRSPARVIVYLWSPLLLFETAHAAHLDGLLLPLLVGIWWARVRDKDALTGVLLGAAAAIKLYPAFLFPALWRPNLPGKRWHMPLGFAAALLVLYLPSLARDGIQVIGFLPDYLRETFNISPLVSALFAGFSRFSIDRHQAILGLTLGALCAAGLWMVIRPADSGEAAVRRSIWLIGIIMLLSQNLFSWYLLWLLPLLAIFLSPGEGGAGRFGLRLPLRLDAWTGWWLFCGLVGLSYSFFIDWKPLLGAALAQFLPLYALLVVDLLSKLWKSWSLRSNPEPA